MNAIEIKNLTKKFKDLTAVDDLCLNIEKGELFALLGQNGAGKTTAIRMLCCLTAPTSGEALLLGDSILKNPEAVKQKLNISPQETAVAPKLSARENLEMIAGIYGFGRQEAKEKAEKMIMDFGLSERAKDRSKKLSGGMQRRLSIAMALISDPEILFLDEPTLGLDVRSRRDLWNALKALKGKKTVILTTHYLEEAEALADRIGIMHNGKLKALGTAAELKESAGEATLEDVFLKLTEEEAAS
jgi:ABC-2 type transport system ATP-binding protein